MRNWIAIALSLAVLGLFLGLSAAVAQLPASPGAPKVGEKAPDFTLEDPQGKPVQLSSLLKSKSEGAGSSSWVVLIFYRGYWCLFCNSELQSFQQRLPEFTKRGIKVVAISVDPPATTRQHLAKTGWTYTFLCDPEAKILKQYDLAHPIGENQVIARPAEFLVDPTGTVRWRDLTEDPRIRTRPETVLEVFDRLASGAPAP